MTRTELIAALEEIGAPDPRAEAKMLICELFEEGSRVFVIDAPLLIEAKMHEDCDTVVTITAPEDVRCERIMKRDGITKEEAMLAIRAQKPDSFYENASSYVISNGGGAGRLEDEFRKLYARLGLNKRR